MEENRVYSEGMWVVHTNYGVGQITMSEKKQLGGENSLYYRVEGDNATFWLSVDTLDSTDRVRPVASKQKLREAIAVMGERPKKLAATHKERVSQIHDIMASGSLLPIAGLLRDLTHQASERNLSIPEQETLEKLQTRIATEWSVVFDINPEEARTKIDKVLSGHAV